MMRKMKDHLRSCFNFVSLRRGTATLVALALLVALLPPPPTVRAAGETIAPPAAAAAWPAQEADSNICQGIIPPQGVAAQAFSDARGWSAPQYYRAIQLADVDGDAHDDLVARGSAGIFVSHFDSQRGQWGALQQSGLLSDGVGGDKEYSYGSMRFGDIDGVKGEELVTLTYDGIGFLDMLAWKYDRAAAQWQQMSQAFRFSRNWEYRQYYSTLRLADIDGDGQAELIARDSNGLVVFHWNKETSNWDVLATGGILSDAGDWDQPEYYETIQFADIDQNGAAELLVRGSVGLLTYRWEAASRAWNPIATLSELSDAGSWVLPEYYATIQTADIDGDGAAELLARGSAGVYTWRWDRSAAAWSQIGDPVGLFSDGGDWNLPRYYETIELADVDGVPGAELLGRARAGMFVFAWNKQNQSWQLTVNPSVGSGTQNVMSDWRGWDTPDAYETIRYGDIDGDGRAEMVGRSGTGIQAYRYVTDGGEPGFAPTRTPSAFPAFAGDELAAYEAISNRLLNRASGGDIRAEYTNTLLSDNFGGNYPGIMNQMPRPDHVRRADWEAVKRQLTVEFSYVAGVNQWFDRNDRLITDLNDSNFISAVTVSQNLEMSLDRGDAFNINLTELVKGLTAGLSGLAESFGQGEIATVITVAGTALQGSGVLDKDNNNNLGLQITEMEERLNDHFVNAKTINGCNEKYYLSDWEMLESLGQPIAEGEIRWDDDLSAALLTEGRRQYEIYLYKTLINSAWWFVNGQSNEDCGIFNNCRAPDDYPRQYIIDNNGDWFGLLHHVKQAPEAQYLDRLFKVPPDGLGVTVLEAAAWINPPGPPSPALTSCSAICLRSPQYYSNNLWNSLPRGRVWIAGRNGLVNTRDVRIIGRALAGGDSPTERFDQQYVTAQLNLLAVRGDERQQAALNSRLSCYGLDFQPFVLSTSQRINSQFTLRRIMMEARDAAISGNEDDMQKLTAVFGSDQFNSDGPAEACRAGGLVSSSAAQSTNFTNAEK